MPLPTLSPADSARVVAQVYTTSLLTVVPIVAAGVAAVALRRAPAAVRVLVWRCAVLALLGALALRVASGTLSLPFTAWVVPAGLASPLVMLGRAQLSVAPAGTGIDERLPTALLSLYLVGLAGVLLVLARAAWQLRAVARRAVPAPAEWRAALDAARARLRVGRTVRLLVSSEQRVPVTWGLLSPVVVVPRAALHWPAAHRDAVLVHELVHVRAWDAAVQLLARLLCAILWFHPGVWWIAARLRAECELACDERVLAAGVRRSDYAELLARAADGLRGGRPLALAVSSRGGLRARLAAIVDSRRELRTATRRQLAAAAAFSTCVTLPTGLAQLAPTRDVLDSLMRDARWESRAYAVTRLAQRSDSVAVARVAATLDPSPRVRALAADALARRGAATTRGGRP